MHGVFKELINGLKDKGPGGFVYVKDDRCAYCFPSDMPNEEFADGMKKMIQNTKDVFFVAEERDSNVHILTYARHVVFEAAEEELKRLASKTTNTANEHATRIPTTTRGATERTDTNVETSNETTIEEISS